MEAVLDALRIPGRGFPAVARALLPLVEVDLCFGVAAAHLLRRCQDRSAFAEVMQCLARHREIPDVAILERLDRGGMAEPMPESPPLLHASLLATMTRPELERVIPARCALAQAARTGLDDSIWCTWSARTWDERWIEATIEQLRSRDPRRDAASIAHSLALPRSTIEQALQALDATTPSSSPPGYALGEALGRSAHSAVFRATRQGDGRAVALKIIRLRGGADACARVLHELDQREPIDHPRLLSPAAWGSLPGDTGIWLELELCRGSVLDRVSEADAPLSVEDARQIALDALEGLAHLHRRGIVHGDLKPGNLLVRQDGSVALTDVGLTRCLASETPSLEAVRVPRFAPPELLGGEVPVERTSDVWSMAATLHFLLTLEPPRDEYARQSELEAARENPVVPLSARRRDVPQELARVVDRALSHDPGARPPDADALRAQLGLPTPGGPPPTSTRWGLAAGLSAVVLIAAVFLAAKLIGGRVVIPPDADIDAAIDSSPPLRSIQIAVDSEPRSANVLLRTSKGSSPLGGTPVHTTIESGDATGSIVVHKPMFETVTRAVDLTRDVNFKVALKPLINVSVDSEPGGADVQLVNEPGTGSTRAPAITPLGKTPLHTQIRKGAGKATLIIRKQMFEDVNRGVDLTRDIKVAVKLSQLTNVKVESVPTGAEVLLRRSEPGCKSPCTSSFGKTPIRLTVPVLKSCCNLVPPAQRTSVLIRMDGFENYETPVDLTHNVDIKAILRPIPQISVDIESTPSGAEVVLRTSKGSASLGKTPVHMKRPREQGTGSISISMVNFLEFTTQVSLTRDIKVTGRLFGGKP